MDNNLTRALGLVSGSFERVVNNSNSIRHMAHQSWVNEAKALGATAEQIDIASSLHAAEMVRLDSEKYRSLFTK